MDKVSFLSATRLHPSKPPKMFLKSGARYTIPIHWRIFFLPDKPIEEPLERLKGEAKRLGIGRSGYHSKRGESFSVPELILLSPQDAKGVKKKEFARIVRF